MLHFAVQELNAIEEAESQIGLESNTSVLKQESREPDLRWGADAAHISS